MKVIWFCIGGHTSAPRPTASCIGSHNRQHPFTFTFRIVLDKPQTDETKAP
jgi:hypothetical protein